MFMFLNDLTDSVITNEIVSQEEDRRLIPNIPFTIIQRYQVENQKHYLLWNSVISKDATFQEIS